MIPIYVYYHIAQMGNWKEVVVEQTTRLRKSGLYNETSKILTGVVGTQEPIRNLPEKFKILFHNPDLIPGEIPTLEALRQHALKENFLVLYIHTKGVSWKDHKKAYNKEAMTAWRKYLEYFCIDKWRECSAFLDEYDASGCELVEKMNVLPEHFRGNFWWSKSSFLRTLPPVNNIVIPNHEVRRKAEFWLGSNPAFKPMSMFNLAGEYREKGTLYNHIIDPRLYTQ